jgi:hypothetical protein
MFRKFVIAAAVALATASFATATPAAAKGGKGFHHHHHGHGHGLRFYSGVGLLAYDSCLRTRWVVNRYGELVRRVVNVCY